MGAATSFVVAFSGRRSGLGGPSRSGALRRDVSLAGARALFLDARASVLGAATGAALLADELGRAAAWQIEQTARFKKLAELPGT